MNALRPIQRLWEETILSWALRELKPTHPIVPSIVRRLAEWERAPSPLDPADTIVSVGCVLSALALLALAVGGWL